MNSIAAGDLNRLVTFQSKSDGADDGYDESEWEDDFEKRVKIGSTKSKETEKSGQVFGESSVVITCRYSSKITANHQILINGITYKIIGEPVNVELANKIMQIHCEVKTDA